MPFLGAHMSIAGGLHLAFARINKVGGEAVQIFTKNQRQWRLPPLTEEEIIAFDHAWRQHGELIVAVHNSYLINLASPDPLLEKRSLEAMIDEVVRAGLLRIPFVIIHPGAHMGAGVEAGIKRIAANLNDVLAATSGYGDVKVLLETTAGQGTVVGSRFEELAAIMERTVHQSRLGVCLDTAHIFAAGYDIRSEGAYQKTMNDFNRLIGISRLHFFHLNDSKGECGSHLDRHEHIGAGRIGLSGFRNLLNDPRFAGHPMTLETPKGEDLEEDRTNLHILRSLMQ